VKYVSGFARFWWDFIVGDDWRIAAGVAAVLGAGAVLVAETDLSDTAVALLSAAGILTVVTTSIVTGAVAAAKRKRF
jgi:hypothetical protein